MTAALGCAAPRAAIPNAAAGDPVAIFAAVRERDDRVRTLRALFAAETEYRGEQRRADGVLLVKKPDRFRLRLMLPLGVTVFDYAAWDGQARVTLPLDPDGAGGSDDFDVFSRGDLGVAFLRDWDGAVNRCVPVRDAEDIVVTCEGSVRGEVSREIRIDGRMATIREETSYEDGRPRLSLRYGDYRQVGESVLPHRVAMVYPQGRLTVTIRVRRYEINPGLPDQLFQPAEP